MIDLFYREAGKDQSHKPSIPVVMLHGLFGSSDNLGALTRAVGQDFKTVAVDMRNHGRSPHVPEMTYPAMAADIVHMLDRLGVEKAHIVGHSMGGKAAMQMALDHGARVARLVVMDIAPVAYKARHTKILAGMKKVAQLQPDSRHGVQEILADYENEALIRGFIATNWRRRADGIWGWRLNLDALIAAEPQIMDANVGTPFTGPVLFLKGGLSDYIKPEHRDAVTALFPHAEARTIENTGHWLHADKPDLVARAILKFLNAEEKA